MKTNKLFNNLSRSIMAASVLMLAQSAFGGVSVVVNPASSLSTVTADDVKPVFLGKSKNISGESVKPIDNASEEVRGKFLESVLGKNPRAFKSHWTRLVFSGKASPLKSASDDAGVKSWVNSTANGVGFIDSKNVDSSVKVIFNFN